MVVRARLIRLPMAWMVAALLSGCQGDPTVTTEPADAGADAGPQMSPTAPCKVPNADGTCATATAPIYVNTYEQLFSFDPLSRQATLVTSFVTPIPEEMWDVAIDRDGLLFGVAESGAIYRINVGNGECATVGMTSFSANALAVTMDNQLAVAGSNVVQIIDHESFAAVRTLVDGGPFVSSGDLVVLPDGFLYWSVMGPVDNDQLILIDPVTGGTALLGTLPASNVWGLAFASGALFGFTARDDFLIINPADAAGRIGATAHSWYGATSNPLIW